MNIMNIYNTMLYFFAGIGVAYSIQVVASLICGLITTADDNRSGT